VNIGRAYSVLFVWGLIGLSGAAAGQTGANLKPAFGAITGVVRDQGNLPIADATITATKLNDSASLTAASLPNGVYVIHDVPPGRYSVMAQKQGFRDFTVSSVQVVAGQTVDMADITMAPVGAPITNVAPGGFWKRFARAYADDWHDRAASGPEPPFRGYPAPESNPPFPFTVWPYGGSPVIGQPNTMLPPLMTALDNGPNGEKWLATNIQFYGWVDAGFNVSSSNKPGFSNAPAAYFVKPNTVTLDQAAIYAERVPDTVQTDHIDWGFRFTTIYGQDYRFTTSKGVFSDQLLSKTARMESTP